VISVLYAQEAGYFREAGIEVDVQKLSSGSAVAAAVAAGAIDIGRSSVLPLINGHARGLPFVLVAGSTNHVPGDPDSSMLVTVDSPIRGARDLNGKTVAVAGLFDLSWLSTKVWIDARGGESTTVSLIEIPNSAMLDALIAHRVDGATLSEPYLSLDLRSGKARRLGDVTGALGAHIHEAAWFTTTSYVQEHRDAVLRFRSIVARAAAYANTHHAETVDLLAAFTGLDTATIAGVHRSTIALSLDPANIQPLIDAAAKYKVIAAPFPARDMMLNRAAGLCYLKKLRAQLGREGFDFRLQADDLLRGERAYVGRDVALHAVLHPLDDADFEAGRHDEAELA
jgi:NitT/TauT family transport system substrate-binding protein